MMIATADATPPAYVQVYAERSMKAVVPECPLREGSVQILPLETKTHLQEWDQNEIKEAYTLLQRIIELWKQKGIHNYLIYAKEPSDKPFAYEIVPYPEEGLAFFQQLSVLSKTIFGAACSTLEERQKTAQALASIATIIPAPSAPSSTRNDVFCDPKVIQKQRVFEGKTINILYNYAPIVDLHFLLVPKQHRAHFSELTQEEYVETVTLTQKLIAIFKDQTAFIFDKSGARAGQTVPHWHEHLVFTSTKTDELLGKATMFWNMLKGRSSPLPPDELNTRVEQLKKQLKPLSY